MSAQNQAADAADAAASASEVKQTGTDQVELEASTALSNAAWARNDTTKSMSTTNAVQTLNRLESDGTMARMFGGNVNWEGDKALARSKGQLDTDGNGTLSKTELQTLAGKPDAPALDRFRAQYLLKNWKNITGRDDTPVASDSDIRTFAKRQQSDRDALVRRQIGPNVTSLTNQFEQLAKLDPRSDQATRMRGDIDRVLGTAEYNPATRNGALNRAALAQNLIDKDLGGIVAKDQLSTTAASGDILMSDISKMSTQGNMKGLAAEIVKRDHFKVDSDSYNYDRISTANLNDYAKSGETKFRPGGVPNAPADTTVGATTSPTDINYNTIRPDQVSLTAANDIKKALDLPPGDAQTRAITDITARLNQNGIMGNEAKMTQVLSALNRDGYLGKLVNSQLGGSNAGIWGWNQGDLTARANDTTKSGMERLAALAAKQNFQQIERADGKDWGGDGSIPGWFASWFGSDQGRLKASELGQFESNRNPVAADTTSIYLPTKTAIDSYTDLANRLQRGENPSLTTARNAIRTDMVNPQVGNPENIGQANALLASLRPEAVARVASADPVFNQLKDSTSGFVTRASLEAALAPTSRADNLSKLTAKALLRDAAANPYGVPIDFGMDQNALRTLAGSGDIAPIRTGEISADLVAKSRTTLEDAVVNPGTPDTLAAQSLAAMFNQPQPEVKWNADFTRGTTNFVRERDGQKYVYEASMTRMPGSRDTYQLTLTEQKAKLASANEVALDRNGNPVGEGPRSTAILATARFDRTKAINDANNLPTLDKQRDSQNRLMQSFRTPEWVRKIDGTDRDLAAATAIPAVTTGDVVTDANAAMNDRAKALYAMDNGAKVTVSINGQDVQATIVKKGTWVGLMMPAHDGKNPGFLLKANVRRDGQVSADGGQWSQQQWRNYRPEQWSIRR